MSEPRFCPWCKKGMLLFTLPFAGCIERICNNCGFVESQAAITNPTTLARKQ